MMTNIWQGFIVFSILVLNCALCDVTLVDDSDAAAATSCRARGLAMYNLTFTALWSEDEFPKQYPLYRPNAQWSKMIGRSHSEEYTLWRFGKLATGPLKDFAEKGLTKKLDKLDAQGRNGILDLFYVPPVLVGTGEKWTTFYTEGKHHQLSLASKIVPSPDWFVGIDSFELCQYDDWVDSAEIDLYPIDAGTDKGFTFTSPNYEEDPHKSISQITSEFPNHDANSFYYPEKERLPPMAKVTITKIKLYKSMDGVQDSSQLHVVVDHEEVQDENMLVFNRSSQEDHVINVSVGNEALEGNHQQRQAETMLKLPTTEKLLQKTDDVTLSQEENEEVPEISLVNKELHPKQKTRYTTRRPSSATESLAHKTSRLWGTKYRFNNPSSTVRRNEIRITSNDVPTTHRSQTASRVVNVHSFSYQPRTRKPVTENRQPYSRTSVRPKTTADEHEEHHRVRDMTTTTGKPIHQKTEKTEKVTEKLELSRSVFSRNVTTDRPLNDFVENTAPRYKENKAHSRRQKSWRERHNSRRNSRRNKNRARKVNCVLGEWAEWSPCSKTCGYGTRTRELVVLVYPRNGGKPCKQYPESELCGSMRTCSKWKHFSFENWGMN